VENDVEKGMPHGEFQVLLLTFHIIETIEGQREKERKRERECDGKIY